MKDTVLSLLLLLSLGATRSLCPSSVSVSGPQPSHQGTLHSDPTPCHYFNQMLLPPLWGQLSFVDCPFSITPCPCPCLPPSQPTTTHTHRQQLSWTRVESLKVRQACGQEMMGRGVRDWKHRLYCSRFTNFISISRRKVGIAAGVENLIEVLRKSYVWLACQGLVCICVVLAHPPGVLLVWSWARLGGGSGGQGLKDRVTLLWDEALNWPLLCRVTKKNACTKRSPSFVLTPPIMFAPLQNMISDHPRRKEKIGWG